MPSRPPRPPRQKRALAEPTFAVPVGTSPARGDQAALVTIVEFGDFQCPFCARVQPQLEAVRKRYGKAVRIVWKNQPLPFHPRAEPAAELALEARAQKGDEAFFRVHDALFRAPDLEEASLLEIAKGEALDLARCGSR